MSVIVAKVEKNKIEVSSDSIVVKGWTKTNGYGNKITKLEEYNGLIIGGCGTAEENSLFFYYIKTHMPEKACEKSILDFIIEFKRWKKDFTNDSNLSNDYILAYRGKCFGIENMLVYEITDYAAIGAGMDYALGALHQGASASEAVKTACDLCAFVSEPIITKIILKNEINK